MTHRPAGTHAINVESAFLKNKVVAHRGAWKYVAAPENSIASLNHAIQIGCEASEFDVRMSADSVLFVQHNSVLQGLEIEKTPSAFLSKLRLENGEKLPTLNEYLAEGINQHRTRLILEIKPSLISKARGIAISRKVLQLVEDVHAEGWVDFISFDYEICKEIIKEAAHANVSYLKGDKPPAELAEDNFYGLDYSLKVLKAQPSWITEAKALNVHVNVWTVDDESDMDFFLRAGVDALTTNEPGLLLKKLSK